MSQATLHPAVGVGHIHLRVADLERATAFYRDVLGFGVTIDGRAFGLQAVFLAAGDYHHHIGLNTWTSAGGTPPPTGHTGLHHVAFVYPNRQELARAVQQLRDHDYPIDEPKTTAAPFRSICATLMATASSYITTAPAKTGSTLRADR